MAEGVEAEAQRLYDEHRDAASKLPEVRPMAYEERRKVALEFLEEIKAAEVASSQGLLGGHISIDDKWEYGHPVDQVIGMIREYGPVVESEEANPLGSETANRDYQANLREAPQHFRDNEEEYKQAAVQNARAAGVEVEYPPYTHVDHEETREKPTPKLELVNLENQTDPADDSTYQVETSLGKAEVSARQETTRAEHVESSGQKFTKDSIDYSAVLSHLGIHTGGEVAGSQFSGELFSSAEDIVKFIGEVLPSELEYDQFGRVELTLDVALPEGQAIGYAGVKSVEELQRSGISPQPAMRTPGGESGEVDGLKGAWYPETVRDASGAFVVATAEDGSVKNPRAKFEPEALIGQVDNPDAAKTTRLSVVIQLDRESGKPVVLTAYPGEIAPPFPVKIDTENFKVNTLHDGPEAKYWKEHAFLKFSTPRETSLDA